MLSISGVARDQVWYKQPLFYNSNFSKPNESVSPFGEAQLDNIKHRSNGNGLSQKCTASLGTFPNKDSYPKQWMKPSLHRSFYQVYWGRPLDNNKFYMDLFSRLKPVVPN